MSYDMYESIICALVLLNVLNLLLKSDKMLVKPPILWLFTNSLMYSIKYEHSCKILYTYV